MGGQRGSQEHDKARPGLRLWGRSQEPGLRGLRREVGSCQSQERRVAATGVPGSPARAAAAAACALRLRSPHGSVGQPHSPCRIVFRPLCGDPGAGLCTAQTTHFLSSRRAELWRCFEAGSLPLLGPGCHEAWAHGWLPLHLPAAFLLSLHSLFHPSRRHFLSLREGLPWPAPPVQPLPPPCPAQRCWR